MLGLALVKLEKEIWEQVFPEHTQTHLCILCPLSTGTITKPDRGDMSGIRGDTSTAINFCGGCVSIWYSSSFQTS